MNEQHETIKHVVDALSILTVLGTLADMLPSVAAVFTIVWTALRIWEMETVRGWTGRLKDKNAIDQ